LAIAAYNCGQVRVKSAIRKTGTESFWNLPLPQETKYYVPRLLAVAAIIKNPEKYGVELPQVSNEPFFEELKVSKPVNLEHVAKSTGVNIETLNKLNPDYTHGSKPVSKAEVKTLLVPVDKVPAVKAHLEA
jgi:membrane-bound lytic murein transglycosylase D